MKKIVLLFTFFVLFVGSVFVVKPQPIYAYSTFNDYVLTGGVGNYGNNKRYYFVSSSASSYSSLINNAMDTWINTSTNPGVTTSISFRSTTDQPSSVMDIYAGSYYPSSTGIIAETKFYLYDADVSGSNGAPTKNWGWNKININNSVFTTLYTFDRQGTIAHEMGHAMGLAHVSSTGAVMSQLGAGRTVNRPAKDDLNGINHLY